MCIRDRDCSDNEKLLYWNFDAQPTELVQDQFNFFDGSISGGTSVPNELVLASLQAEIVVPATNGSAILGTDFELSYVPDPSFSGLDSIIYQLTFGECDSSRAAVTFQVDQTTATDDLSNEDQFIFPNPTSGEIFLDVDDIQRIELYSVTGELIELLPVKAEFDLGHLSDGVYIVTIQTKDGKILSQRIIKLWKL